MTGRGVGMESMTVEDLKAYIDVKCSVASGLIEACMVQDFECDLRRITPDTLLLCQVVDLGQVRTLKMNDGTQVPIFSGDWIVVRSAEMECDMRGGTMRRAQLTSSNGLVSVASDKDKTHTSVAVLGQLVAEGVRLRDAADYDTIGFQKVA